MKMDIIQGLNGRREWGGGHGTDTVLYSALTAKYLAYPYPF